MKKTPNPKRPGKYKFYIPAKLQSSLFEDVTSLWWKDVIESIEKKDFNSILKILKKLTKPREHFIYPTLSKKIQVHILSKIYGAECVIIFFSVIQVEIINGYCVSRHPLLMHCSRRNFQASINTL